MIIPDLNLRYFSIHRLEIGVDFSYTIKVYDETRKHIESYHGYASENIARYTAVYWVDILVAPLIDRSLYSGYDISYYQNWEIIWWGHDGTVARVDDGYITEDDARRSAAILWCLDNCEIYNDELDYGFNVRSSRKSFTSYREPSKFVSWDDRWQQGIQKFLEVTDGS